MEHCDILIIGAGAAGIAAAKAAADLAKAVRICHIPCSFAPASWQPLFAAQAMHSRTVQRPTAHRAIACRFFRLIIYV